MSCLDLDAASPPRRWVRAVWLSYFFFFGVNALAATFQALVFL